MSKLADRPAIRSARAKIRHAIHHVRLKYLGWYTHRLAIAVLSLLVLTWFFGQAGVLDKLDRVASDIQSHANPVPTDGTVALVVIDDSDYRQIFDGGIPANADRLVALVNAIARGGPSVIGIDIDSSPHQFASIQNSVSCSCSVVWEREVEEMPEKVEANQELKLLPFLGDVSDLGKANTSSGVPILIDDPEDGATRRYQRYFSTNNGFFPSFSTAVITAYAKENHRPELESQVAGFSDRELLIRYSGDQQGSHRVRLSATRVKDLSPDWNPDASPIKGRIVLLGGSYLGEDEHKTPLGRLSGVEVLANVIETELHGSVPPAPSRFGSYMIDLIEAFPLILAFHFMRFRKALIISAVLTPVFAVLCSLVSYYDAAHVGHFLIVLLGLLCFELYEHFRREQFPHLIAHRGSEH